MKKERIALWSSGALALWSFNKLWRSGALKLWRSGILKQTARHTNAVQRSDRNLNTRRRQHLLSWPCQAFDVRYLRWLHVLHDTIDASRLACGILPSFLPRQCRLVPSSLQEAMILAKFSRTELTSRHFSQPLRCTTNTSRCTPISSSLGKRCVNSSCFALQNRAKRITITKATTYYSQARK